MKEFFIAIAGIITTSATGHYAYKAGKRKSLAEAKGLEIDNDIKRSNHHIKLLDDLTERYEKRYKEFEEMTNRKVELLEEEIRLKDRKIKLQQQEITELKRENKLLRNAANRTT
ncbi:hypothetical protein R1T16_17520 [Flavobacterium sp. DG1-102-2]|uniref:hypothetical protein n=1 Tax=Flavobacterium sp. DG1-102-2 TaxID=3081663 RepID=UPI0029490E87|nr:hypothetical protein [Flavobacterium sp. DG1-102-2]MDV6170240.1 hypothetical protein [Flavobacterium sp. DG1-102-2]